jgi:WD40 repeat protein
MKSLVQMIATMLFLISGQLSDGKAQPTSAAITAMAFSASESKLFVGSQAGLGWVFWKEKKQPIPIPTHLQNTHHLALSPDEKQLAVAGGIPGELGMLEIWSLGKDLPPQRVEPHTDLIYEIAWSPDGSRIATASADGTCCICDVQTTNTVIRFSGHSRSVSAVGFLDNETVVSGGADGSLRIWNTNTGEVLRTLDNHTASVTHLAMKPNAQAQSESRLISISDDRTARLWNPRIGRMIRFTKLPAKPRSMCWISAGNRIAIGLQNGTIQIFDAETLQEEASYPGNVGVVYEIITSGEDAMMIVGGEKGLNSIELIDSHAKSLR